MRCFRFSNRDVRGRRNGYLAFSLSIMIHGCSVEPSDDINDNWEPYRARATTMKACVSEGQNEKARSFIDRCVAYPNATDERLNQCERMAIRNVCPTVPSVTYKLCDRCMTVTEPCAEIRQASLKELCN